VINIQRCLPAVIVFALGASLSAQQPPPVNPPPPGFPGQPMPVNPPDPQQPQQQRPLAQGAQGPDLSPAEIQRLFDGMMVVEAQDQLTLTDKQYPDFITRLRALQDTRRRNQQQRSRIMMELQRMTNPRNQDRIDEPAIRQRLIELQELESRMAAELRQAYQAIDAVLDVRQQARFRIFEEQIERRRFELLQRARQLRQQQQPRRQ
jgi:hypothetical protein